MRVSLPGRRTVDISVACSSSSGAVEKLKYLPNVHAASATGFLPFTGDVPGTYVGVAGQPVAEPGEELLTLVQTVMPGYFETLGIPVVQGRTFTSDDNRDTAPMEYVVNQEFVRRYLQEKDPLHERVSVLMRDKIRIQR